MTWIKSFALISFIVLFSNIQFLNNENNNEKKYFELLNTNLCSWNMYMNDTKHTGQSEYYTLNNTGSLNWKFQNEEPIVYSSVMDPNGNIYFISYALIGNFTSLNYNGTLKWKYTPEYKIIFHESPTVGKDGRIYVGSFNYTNGSAIPPYYKNSSFYAFNPDGSIAWEIRDNGAFLASPAVDKNGTIYTASTNGNLFVIYMNGTLKWKYEFNSTLSSHSAIALDNNENIYFCTHNYLFCIFPNGTLKWTLEGGWNLGSVSIGPDGTIYAFDMDKLKAINPDGSLKWWKTLMGPEAMPSVDQSSNLYIPWSRGLYKYNKTGDLVWTFYLDVYEDSGQTPAIISKEGTLYMGTRLGYLYAIDQNGIKKWSFKTGNTIYESPFIDSKGNIYFGSEDKYFYCIGKWIPSPPQNIVGNFKDEEVSLKWDYPQFDGGKAITDYRIFRKSELDQSFSMIQEVNGSSLNYSDNSVMNGIEYQYYITAINSINESMPSNLVSGIPKGLSDPPSNVTISFGDKFILITWTAPIDTGGLDLLSIRLYESTNGIDFSLKYIIPSKYSFINDTEVMNGIKYHYYLTAKNDLGESGKSELVTAIPSGLPDPPQNPYLEGSPNYVHVHWSKPDNDGGTPIQGYHIIKNNSINGKMIILEFNNGTFFFNDSSVEIGIEYSYYLRSRNSIGFSSYTNALFFTPVTYPFQPLEFKLLPGEGAIELHWTLPQSDGGANIEFNLYKGPTKDEMRLFRSFDNSTRTFLDDHVVNGKEYFYYLTANNSYGESSPTNILSGIPQGISTPPENLSGRPGNRFNILYWEKPRDTQGSDLIGYNVYRSESGYSPTLLLKVDETVNEYNDTNLENGKEYRYFITVDCKVFNNDKESTRSNEVSLIPLGVSSEPLDLEIIPKKGFFELRWKAPIDNGGTDIMEYSIFRKNSSDGLVTKTNIPSLLPLYTDHSIEYYAEYSYWIIAVNIVGDSPPSAIKIVKSLSPPLPPTDLNGKYHDGVIELAWAVNRSDEIQSSITFHIYRGENPGQMERIGTIENITEFKDNEIKDGIDYFYYITAENDIGESEESQIIQINIPKEQGSISFLLIILLILVLLGISIFIILLINKKRNNKNNDSLVNDME